MSRRFDPKPRRSALAVLAVIAITVLWLAPGGRGVPEVRAAASVNLDQWATIAPAWQNGNLNGNNTRYPEGGIVPFRLAIEGLKAGAHSIRIQYDFTAGGHKAYDFLALYTGWVSAPSCARSGGGISSMCPSLPGSSSRAFPSDGFSTDGQSVRDAEAYSGVSRRLTIWGGSIASITGPVHAGSTSGNSTAEFTVRFTSTGSAVLLAWGGHLAQSRFWNMANGGPRDGAGEVSGAPWHMRTLQLDGSGNRNQDRSIQPSAIVGELGPRALAPATPRPTATPRAAVPPPPAAKPTPRPGTAGSTATERPVPTAPPTSTDLPLSVGTGSGPQPALAMILLFVGGLVSLILVRSRSAGRWRARDR